MGTELCADMLRELLPLAQMLRRDDQMNTDLGIEWDDGSEYLSTRLTCGLLRRVLAAHEATPC